MHMSYLGCYVPLLDAVQKAESVLLAAPALGEVEQLRVENRIAVNARGDPRSRFLYKYGQQREGCQNDFRVVYA